MLASSLFSLVALATTAIAGPEVRAAPALPATRYLFTATLNIGAPISLGHTPAGNRSFVTVTGGNFSGPGLNGKVVGGLDWGLVDDSGSFNPDVAYLLQTSDGSDIFVRERGHSPNVFLLFETSSEKYAYLNTAVAYGRAARVATGLAVDVFRIGVYRNDTH